MENIKSFDINKLLIKGPQKKTIEDKGISYNLFSIDYDYSTDPKIKNIKPFMVELFEMEAKWGFSQVLDSAKDNQPIEGKFSISTILDESNEDHMKLINFLDLIYDVIAKFIVGIKYKGYSDVVARGHMKKIYAVPVNENTGERILDKSLSFKTIFEKYNKLFFPDKSECLISNLKDLSFTFIPLYKFQIFSGTLTPLLIQKKLQSMIITSVAKRGGGTFQALTCEKMTTLNPNMAENIRSQLELLNGNAPSRDDVFKTKEIESLNQTLSNIVNTDKKSYPARSSDDFMSRSELMKS